MYTVTFYSFKGGVGRTLALANVAAELANRGRTVLIVDFDLEAPGIETFPFCNADGKVPGIVDYITEYTSTGIAPPVEDYVRKCAFNGVDLDSLWLMAAGKPDDSYGRRLQTIDWQKLYREQDGYIMMEDLKQQWREFINPDYVLIDSRTGHTDVSGICTRQLPDAVVAMFFPNEQNLVGLRKVVGDIKNEGDKRNDGSVFTHFVVSNVPDLDDENEILENHLEKFREAFESDESCTIHHYDSLLLLDQVIFTLSRPRTRLAREYRNLTDVIVRQNIEDREGAIQYLQENARSAVDISRLNKIKSLHTDDGEVLYNLADVSEQQGNFQEALELFSAAISNGYRPAKIFRKRSSVNKQLNNYEDVTADLREILEAKEAEYLDIAAAVIDLRERDPGSLRELPNLQSFLNLDKAERQVIATFLMSNRDTLEISEEILRKFLDDNTNIFEYTTIELMLCLIGEGKFGEAMKLVDDRRAAKDSEAIQVLFNYAMARWGETMEPPRDLLCEVVELDRQSGSRSTTANYALCMTIANVVCGDTQEAELQIEKARDAIENSRWTEFSPWRYLYVSRREFREDIEFVQKFISGEQIQPDYIAACR